MTSELTKKYSDKTIQESIACLSIDFEGQIVFSTSFGVEDQVITDIISKANLNVEIFTLDTGRLFTETYSTWNSTIFNYGISIKSYFPKTEAIEKFMEAKGPNAFYNSVENRQECCGIRKVEPLKRALKGKKIWITGIRSEQSANRNLTEIFEWDANNEIIKYNPLLNWTFEDVKNYIKVNNVPYNPLHDKGFASIGCQPCTRAIQPGEDFRAGRWWWEDSSKKECGLHVHSKTR